MAKNTNYISHCVGVQLRVVGSGSLNLNLYSIDEDDTFACNPITMLGATGKLGTTLANFRSQQMQLEIKTDAINEYFRVGKITVYVKPAASGYPL